MAEKPGKFIPRTSDQSEDLPEYTAEIVRSMKKNLIGRWAYERDGLARFGLLPALEKIGAVPLNPNPASYGAPPYDASEEEHVAWEDAHPDASKGLFVAQQTRDQILTYMYLGAMARVMISEDPKRYLSNQAPQPDYSPQSLQSYFREMYVQGYVNYYRHIIQPDSSYMNQLQQAGIISAIQNPHMPYRERAAFRKWQVDHDQFLDPAQQYAYYSLGIVTAEVMANIGEAPQTPK